MTNEELNKELCKLMGWVKGESIGYAPSWYYELEGERPVRYKKVILISDWKPTEDLKQAFECLKHIKDNNIEIYKLIGCEEWWVTISFIKIGSSDLSEAICKALYKTMEG